MVPLSARITLPPSKRTLVKPEDVVVKVPLAEIGGDAAAPVTPTAAPRIATTHAKTESLEGRAESATANVFCMCSSQSPAYGEKGKRPSLHQSPCGDAEACGRAARDLPHTEYHTHRDDLHKTLSIARL